MMDLEREHIQVMLGVMTDLYKRRSTPFLCIAATMANVQLTASAPGPEWGEACATIRRRIVDKIEGWHTVETYLQGGKGKDVEEDDATCRRFRYKLLRALKEEFKV